MPASEDAFDISAPLPPDDARLLEALRAGDEAAFEILMHRYYSAMLRMALIYVPDQAAAEDVIQETWIGVLRGLERFEGRSSLKTWIFSILMNKARTRARREQHSIPFSALEHTGDEPPIIEELRAAGEFAGHWTVIPHSWEAIPEQHLISQETQAYIQQAIAALAPTQREVITLRDIEHWSAEEVCNVLGITETNQRVLLHRARSRVRRALAAYLSE